ncbi:MAG: ABC transporter permease, partial [Bacteroidota bacterium]
MRPSPPKWADRFLEWFCHPDLLEDLQGDLYELFEEKIDQNQPVHAQSIYVWHVIRSLRYDVINPSLLHFNFGIMLKNNLKIAFRVMLRNKLNTTLNIGGLAIGLTCFLLMGFFVKQELSFDQMHIKKDRIYRTWVKEDYGNDKVFFNSVTPVVFESVLEENFPEIDKVVTVTNNNWLVGEMPNCFNERVHVLGHDFFDVFDFEIVEGDQNNPFQDRNGLILSQEYAKKYFGDQNPIGQSLSLTIGENERSFTVNAVVKKISRSSSIQFDMAISSLNNDVLYSLGARNSWFSVTLETYILLNKQKDISEVEAKTQKVIMSYLENEVEPGQYQIGFQPLTDIHLNPEVPFGIAPVGNPKYVYILGLIGLFVLIVAGINYATLAIGQSFKRRKEVGLRKVLGAGKNSLKGQYLVESWVITAIATGMSVLFAYLLLPLFNRLTNADVDLTFESWHLLLYLGIIFLVGTLAGLYPSLILSNLQITKTLRGEGRPKKAFHIRKGLVAFQFIITVFLITATLVMNRQLNYMQTKDLGFDYNALVQVPLYSDPSAKNLVEAMNSTLERGELLKVQIQTNPAVSDVGMGSHVVGSPPWGQFSYTDDQQIFRSFRILMVDPAYLNTFDIQLKEGRFFEEESTMDQRESIIINEAAAEYFGLDNPIGKRLPGNDFGEHKIIGVTENFNYASLHTEIQPLVITQNIGAMRQGVSDIGFRDSPIPKLVFRFNGSQLSKVEGILKEPWQKVFPEESLQFSFIQDNLMAQYENEKRMNQLVSFATILSIIVASLGLLGMTIILINSRLKEIGIRKVIGASDLSIFGLLAKAFIPQLVIGIVLSIPLTYWLMKDWLNNFA